MEQTVKYVDVHTHHFPEREDVLALLSFRIGTDRIETGRPYSCGIHPWDTQSVDINAIATLISNTPMLYAIGEIGLDYFHGQKNRNIQVLYFTRQLDIAVEYGLPVVIHCVKAYDDLLPILAEYLPKLRGAVIHGFIGDPVLAGKLTGLGVCLSFGPRSLNSHKTVEALRETPPEKIFLETDESGTDIADVYALAAQKLDLEPSELQTRLTRNFQNLFE